MSTPTTPVAHQCAKCPWLKDVDPHEIPNGYCPTKHAALSDTIAHPDSGLMDQLRIMACHETPVGKERPCVGWLANQLGPGNNLALRLAVITKRIAANFKLHGPQHATFEDTLPPTKKVKTMPKFKVLPKTPDLSKIKGPTSKPAAIPPPAPKRERGRPPNEAGTKVKATTIYLLPSEVAHLTADASDRKLTPSAFLVALWQTWRNQGKAVFVDTSTLAQTTKLMRRLADEMGDHLAEIDVAISNTETAAGLVDPETGARFDE